MREFRLYEGSDGGSKGPRCVNCGPLGDTETDLEGWVGIHHNFGHLGPFGQRPNEGLNPSGWAKILFYPLSRSCLV